MLHSFVHVANLASKTYQLPGYGGPDRSVKTDKGASCWGGVGVQMRVAKATMRRDYIKILNEVQLAGDERQRGDEG